MAEYKVEVQGEAREVYIVDADSPEDAMERWHEGQLVLTEVSSAGPVSAELDDDA